MLFLEGSRAMMLFLIVDVSHQRIQVRRPHRRNRDSPRWPNRQTDFSRCCPPSVGMPFAEARKNSLTGSLTEP